MKKNELVISKEEAKSILINSQGLHNMSNPNERTDPTLDIIQKLGYIQLDTLSVVARAHHHTLWVRNNMYQETNLDTLMKEKKIFEYWSHAAAYLPMEDYRYSLYRKNEFLNNSKPWFKKHKKICTYILDRIKSEGSLQSKDFETDRKRGPWWDWKPAKMALEHLFHIGTLMVKERKGFQKVYDLTERILPNGTDTNPPTQEEFASYLILSALRANGIASLKDMTHLRKGMTSITQKVIKRMILDDRIVQVTIDNVSEKYFQLLENNVKFQSQPDALTILSPFDNAIIRRDRLKQLFDYEFVLECYLPEHKRKYGYFCLPILYENEFIGKFDPKVDRTTGVFYIKSFYLEKIPMDMDNFIQSFTHSLKAFAKFNACEKIVVEKTVPSKLKKLIMHQIY